MGKVRAATLWTPDRFISNAGTRLDGFSRCSWVWMRIAGSQLKKAKVQHTGIGKDS
jgi:hypothetical protein